jgi:hypothetical protein
MKNVIILFLIYLIFSSNKSTVNPRASGTRFLAKFNILPDYVESFKAKIQAAGMKFVEVYEADRYYQGIPLKKITFEVIDTQLTEFDKLKVLNEVEFVSLLILE